MSVLASLGPVSLRPNDSKNHPRLADWKVQVRGQRPRAPGQSRLFNFLAFEDALLNLFPL